MLSRIYSRNAGGFLPRGVPFKYGRHDQGRDIQTGVGQAIIAPGRGRVLRWGNDPADPKNPGGHFGPAYPIIHLASGPYKGRDIYIGHTVAAKKPGKRFWRGNVIAHTTKRSAMNGLAPDGWAEIGYAPGGSPGPFGQPAPF